MAQGSRPDRVAEEIRQEIGQLLTREVHDPGVGFITITRVKVSPDLQLARVYYTQIGDDKARKNTVKALDSAIGALEAQPTAEARRLLPQAYDMRARSLFSLGKEPEARRDFTSLLKTEPGYVLTGQVSPRIIAMYEEVTKVTVTEFRLAVTPADAEVLLDGTRVPATGTFPIAVGGRATRASGTASSTAATKVLELGPGQTR